MLALACSEPPAGHARWTLRLLADRLVELEIVATVLAPPAAAGVEFLVWGDAGISILPARESEALACAAAVDELVELAGSGRTDHPCDLRLGVHVVELMAAAAIS